MNRKVAYSLLGAGALLLTAAASDAQAFEMLGRLFGGHGRAACDCDSSCAPEPGCAVADECGCEPSCCEPAGCKPRLRRLCCFRLPCLKLRRCQPACEPVCCEPACEPACDEPACDAPCCEPKRRGCCGLLRGLLGRHRGLGASCCAADCDCCAPVSCGCSG
ncbi:MAG: hypothetical protein A2W31_03620 [Planctomycetes bacterium RBG_16_64_10]|nr:MAG: hypothetical protein A2W31_03620 [Planctomycetes bacterium RBG_16_64_10]